MNNIKEFILGLFITVGTIILTVVLIGKLLEESNCLKGVTRCISETIPMQCQIILGIIGIVLIIISIEVIRRYLPYVKCD